MGRARAALPYVHELGYLAVCWNQLHHHLSGIFSLLLQSSDGYAGQTIWHSLDSDFAQRKMLRALLELDDKIPSFQRHRRLPKNQQEDILWILNQIDNPFRYKRNNAIHAPLMVVRNIAGGKTTITVEAHFNPHNPRARPLRGKDIKQEYREYAAFAEMLSGYAYKIFVALSTSTTPWPNRPPLPEAHKKKQKAHRARTKQSTQV
jgi:hypothetical protein